MGTDRGVCVVDPPRRLSPAGDHLAREKVRGERQKTRAGPEGERSENVDPTGVEVDADVDFAPSPDGPERVARAGVAPEESDPGRTTRVIFFSVRDFSVREKARRYPVE